MRNLCLMAGMLLLLSGCMVANFYVTFPQKDLEKAAQQLEFDVQKASPPAKGGHSMIDLRGFWEPQTLFAQVVTSEPKISSSAIDEAKARRNGRIPNVQPFKNKGAVGENNVGLLEIVPGASLSSAEAFQLQKLVRDENRDRMLIYQEFIKINNMTKADLKRVQAAFAKTQRENANSGEMVQNSDGSWSAKK